MMPLMMKITTTSKTIIIKVVTMLLGCVEYLECGSTAWFGRLFGSTMWCGCMSGSTMWCGCMFGIIYVMWVQTLSLQTNSLIWEHACGLLLDLDIPLSCLSIHMFWLDISPTLHMDAEGCPRPLHHSAPSEQYCSHFHCQSGQDIHRARREAAVYTFDFHKWKLESHAKS